MLQTEIHQKCVQCPLTFPRSKLHQHVLSHHGEGKKDAVSAKANISDEYGLDDEEDMELDEDDEDVKQFLEDTDTVNDELDAEGEDDTEIPESEIVGSNADLEEASVVEEEDDKSLVECDICQQKMMKDLLDGHLAQKHDIVKSRTEDSGIALENTNSKDETKSEVDKSIEENTNTNDSIDNSMEDFENEECFLGDVCEMCDVNVGSQNIVDHLAEEHFIRVFINPNKTLNSSLNSSLDSSTDETFEMPDFLKSSSEVFNHKCHHCQKGFKSVSKMEAHMSKKHTKRCRVCKIQQLVAENRYLTIMKQLRNAKFVDKDDIPSNNSITSGEYYNRVWNYEELYPELHYTCWECEDEATWPEADHTCPLVSQNIRILSGVRLARGKMVTGELADHENLQSEYDIVPSALAQSQVKKLALEQVSNVVSEALDQVLDNVVLGHVVSHPPEDLTHLQATARSLADRYESREERVPDIVQRAIYDSDFEGGSANNMRKLLGFLVTEYGEDIEKKIQEDLVKKTEERKQLQEDARREMNQKKVFDYSKYMIPNSKMIKKNKIMNPLQQSPSSTGSENQENSCSLPTGDAVSEANSKTYLNNTRKKQLKTSKLRSIMPANRPRPVLVPLSSNNKPIPGPPGPGNIPQLSNAIEVKVESARPLSRTLPNGLVVRVEKPSSVTEVPKPASTLQVQTSTSNAPSSLKRLESLGLSVTVKDKAQTLPKVPNQRLPSTKPTSATTKSVTVKKTSMPSVTRTQPILKPKPLPRSTISSSTIRIAAKPPVSTRTTLPSSGVSYSARFSSPSPSMTVQRGPLRSFPMKVPIARSMTTTTKPTVTKVQGNHLPTPKYQFDEKQKLMLRFQILSYRKLLRREALDDIVIQAATNKDFRSMKWSPAQTSSLKKMLEKEYSEIRK